jgi:hypothetical protein
MPPNSGARRDRRKAHAWGYTPNGATAFDCASKDYAGLSKT